MMRHHLCAFGLLAFIAATPAAALSSVLVGKNFDTPVFLTAPVGDSRLFVVEKTGRIQVSQDGSVSTYLDISDRVDTAGERGLLGMAFDPGFAANGRFYVNYIDARTQDTVVAAFTAPSAALNTADPNSGETVITITQPSGVNNHKAGWIGFRGTDPGQLYIATGDGGGSNDPFEVAQNTSSNLGKILRVTPTVGGGYTVPGDNPFVGGDGNDEIWAYGLRNPYRNSFDRLSGDFWIADVGQNAREEINFEAAASPGGVNYGWRAREGSIDNPNVDDPAPATAVDPIFDYEWGTLGRSVIGGYVYHGVGEPGLEGAYFFGDFGSGRIFTLDGGLATGFTDRTPELGTPFGANTLSSFGEDGFGNLYALGLNGEVYRIAAAVPEPGTWAMLASGLLLVSAMASRRRKGQNSFPSPGFSA